MARKTFVGEVVSNKTQKTVVVRVDRHVRHPIYKKTLKRTTKMKADTNSFEVKTGQTVKIEQSRPLSRDKHFKVIKILDKEGEQSRSRQTGVPTEGGVKKRDEA